MSIFSQNHLIHSIAGAVLLGLAGMGLTSAAFAQANPGHATSHSRSTCQLDHTTYVSGSIVIENGIRLKCVSKNPAAPG